MSHLQLPHRMFAAVLCLSVLTMTGDSPAQARSTGETIDYVLPRVVKIFGAGGLQNLAAYGTGFLVSREGHIVTVWSHVLDPEEVIVVLNDGRRYPAKVLGAEPQLDLAVLQIDRPAEELDLPHFDLDSSVVSASAGTRVLAFSNMFKVATGDEPVSVLHGVVAARTPLRARRGTFEVRYSGDVYIVDAITNNSGAAGGILTTREGRLLGVIGRELRNAETSTWVNYSIPLSALTESIGQIIKGEFRSQSDTLSDADDVQRYVPADFGIVMVPDVLFRTPAYVHSALAGSEAEQAGLRPDDLIVFVNDDLVQSIREMQQIIGKLEAGDTLRLVARRGDELVTFEFRAPKKPLVKTE